MTAPTALNRSRVRTARVSAPKVNQQIATTVTEDDLDRFIELCRERAVKPAALLREVLVDVLDEADRARAKRGPAT